MRVYRRHISSIGDASANVIAVTCYFFMLFFWTFSVIPILLIFFLEKKSGLVRFHAMQAFLMWLVRTFCGGGIAFEALAAVLTGDSVYMQDTFGWSGSAEILITRIIIDTVIIFFVLLALYYASRWEIWRIPFIGQLAGLVCRHARAPMYEGAQTVPEGCLPERTPDASGYDVMPYFDDLEHYYGAPDNMAVYAAAVATDVVEPDKAGSFALDEGKLAAEKEVRIEASPNANGARFYTDSMEHEEEDANMQLPMEMRDAPMQDDESAPAGARQKLRRKRRRSTNVNEEKTAGNNAGGAYGAGFAERIFENVVQEKPAEPKGNTVNIYGMTYSEDPNSMLPPEMRDAPLPADMMDPKMPADMY